MPSSLTGLLIFIALLAPGLTYSAYRSANKPAEKPSALRELGGIALRSLVCNVVALIAFAIIHEFRPAWTPDVGRLIRGDDEYLQLEYDSLLWWGLALIVFACAIGPVAATIIGSKWWSTFVTTKPISWMTPTGGVTTESAWWGLFTAHPESKVYVECFLTDQSYLSGWLLSYSPDSEETENRELVLTEPTYRAPDADDTTRLQVGAVAVSARRIQYLSVSYLDSNKSDLSEANTANRFRVPFVVLLLFVTVGITTAALIPLATAECLALWLANRISRGRVSQSSGRNGTHRRQSGSQRRSST